MSAQLARFLRAATTASVVVVFTVCNAATIASAPIPDGALRVLFIGNSLTYTNDLPTTLADLASSGGGAPCFCASVAYPNFALVDHLAQGEAVRLLGSTHFDFVVMQQGPSASAEGREYLIQGVGSFAPFIARSGARPAVLSVWPDRSRMGDFPGVLASAYAAATSVENAMVLPAGSAWLEAWKVNPTLSLYGPDGFHPSPLGTYLTALVIYQRLFGRSVVDIQAKARVGGVTQSWSGAILHLLQNAAEKANLADGRP